LQAATQVLNIVNTDEALNGTSRGLKLRIDTHSDDIAEALFITRTIDELIGGMQFNTMDRGLKTVEDSGLSGLSDIAVLCRTRQQMKMLERIFSDKNIPYHVVGSETLFHQEPFKTILDIINYTITPENTLSQEILKEKGINTGLLENLIHHNKNIVDKTEAIFDLFPELKEKTEDFTFQQFKSLANKFEHDIPGFIQSCKLGTDLDVWQHKAEKVSIMTIHASKGLEFGCVFIPGCEEGIIPNTLYRENTDLSEEIRLLYVGMTRASKYLFLSHAYRRSINNREVRLNRSPFLDQIANTLFEISQKEKKKEKPVDNQLKLF
jgi:superfamily I DNA/RNA helicase